MAVVANASSSLGLIRLRVRTASQELSAVFDALLKKYNGLVEAFPFRELSDDDIAAILGE